jgi:hypothetical protein
VIYGGLALIYLQLRGELVPLRVGEPVVDLAAMPAVEPVSPAAPPI